MVSHLVAPALGKPINHKGNLSDVYEAYSVDLAIYWPVCNVYHGETDDTIRSTTADRQKI